MSIASPPVVAGMLDAQARVDLALVRVVEEARARSRSFGPDYDVMWTEIERSVRGGKRFRSAIVLGAHAALGGPNPEAAVDVAAGFEMLHTAFLVHDDLIDRDTVRRGTPNLAAVMGARARRLGAPEDVAHRWSEAAAVLAGDLALSAAHRLIVGVDLPGDRRTALLDLLDETLLISAGGELADTAYGLGLHLPSLEEALLVCESKTAMYSFRAPLRAAGILAEVDGAALADLDHVGRLLGRSFQLVDDLLGVFAPESEIGKSNMSDLREGKHTALILHARTMPVWTQIEGRLGDPHLDRRTADRMRRALARSAAPERVADQAREDLAGVESRMLDARWTPALRDFIGGMVDQLNGALDTVLGHVEAAR